MCPAEERNVETQAEPGATILLVEDETLIRISAAEHLREVGFVVLEAATGAEARAIVEAGVDVDLVFSDINMPGGVDGVTLAQWLAAQDYRPLVLLASGVATVLDAAKASCPNVKAFLEKPYAYDEMEQQIRAALLKREI